MKQILIELFCYFGLVTFVVLLVIGLAYLKEKFDDWLDLYKYKKRIKTRFDKPPQAKCFCICCNKWDPMGDRSGYCDEFCVATDDSEFCDRAYPRDNKSWEDAKSIYEFRHMLKEKEKENA